MQVTGVVKNFSFRDWKSKKFYSMCVTVNGSDTWYGTGETDPTNIPKGSTVSFEAEKNNKGFWNVEGEIEVVSAASAPSSGSSGGTSYAARESYWQEKADRDLLNDERYNVRAAHMLAKDVVLGVYAQGKLSVKAGKDLETILNTINMIADDYAKMWMDLGKDEEDVEPDPSPDTDEVF